MINKYKFIFLYLKLISQSVQGVFYSFAESYPHSSLFFSTWSLFPPSSFLITSSISCSLWNAHPILGKWETAYKFQPHTGCNFNSDSFPLQAHGIILCQNGVVRPLGGCCLSILSGTPRKFLCSWIHLIDKTLKYWFLPPLPTTTKIHFETRMWLSYSPDSHYHRKLITLSPQTCLGS